MRLKFFSGDSRMPRSSQTLCLVVLLAGLAAPASADITRLAIIGNSVANWQDPEFAPLDTAIEQFQQQDYEAASASLASLVKANPQLPPAKILLSQMYFGVGDVASGRQTLESASAEHPTEAEPLVILGELDLREGRMTSSTALFEKAIDLVHKAKWKNEFRRQKLLANSQAGLAAAAASRGDWRLSQAATEAWIKLAPKSSQAYAKLGEALFHQGDTAEAYAAFQTSSKLTDEGLPAEIAMAMLYDQQAAAGHEAKRTNAQRAMERAIQLSPKKLQVRLLAGVWALEAGRLQFADEQVAAALTLQGDNSDALFLAGVIDRSLGRHMQAVERFRSLAAKQPANMSVVRQLNLSLLDLEGGNALALEYARLYHAAERNRESSVLLAWALINNNAQAEAVQLFNNLPAGNLTAEATAIAGRVLLAMGHKQQATDLLRSAAKAGRYFPGRELAIKMVEELQ